MQRLTRLFALVVLVAASVSCGKVLRDSRAPVYLVIDQLTAAAGNRPTTLTSFLLSSVVTAITTPAPCTPAAPCLTSFNDVGSAALRTPLKDVASTTTPASPTANNEVTINRYHVAYRRADGRNTPGVDVPYGFDGAVTGTIPANGSLTLGFELVRHVAKSEEPLVRLRGNPTIITTIADVTFYGQDRVGNAVSVTGSIQVDFGDFRNQ
jgi:hypothetical protein